MHGREQSLKECAQKVIAYCEDFGATNVAVSIESGKGFSLSVRNQEIDLLEYREDFQVSLTAYLDQQVGHVSLTEIHDEAIRDAAKMACHIARQSAADPAAGLPEKHLLAKQCIDLDLYHPWDIEIDAAAELARNLEKQALQLDRRLTMSEGASVESYESIQVHANSLDFMAAEFSSEHSLNLALIAEDKGQKERESSYSIVRDAADLWSIERIAKEAAAKAVGRLNASKIKTQKLPILFNPQSASSLFSHFLQAISGENLYRDMSFLKDKINTAVFPDFITFYEDPFVKKGLRSSNFDEEGVAAKALPLVEKGVLKQYLLDTYSAKRLKLTSNGHAGGAYNLFVISDVKEPFQHLLAKFHHGLLITDLMGRGVNPITGDYSRGASGFWVENGEICYPVHEITLAGNLIDMYQGIAALGDDADPRTRVQTGSVLIEEMVVSGN